MPLVSGASHSLVPCPACAALCLAMFSMECCLCPLMLFAARSAEYILKNGGIDTEEDYSYWSVGGMCNKLREGDISLLCTLSEPSCGG